MSDKVLFLDLETTGLSPKFCSILEVAAVVVTADLQTVDQYETVVYQDYKKIHPEMDAWCLQTHSASGLLDEVNRSPFSLTQVDERLHQFIKKNFPDGAPVELGGNSVHFDLSFIREHMPRTASLLSHRLQDVSGAARMVRRFLKVEVPNVSGMPVHRAMPDVRQSIEQLRVLREVLRGGTTRAA